MDVPIEINKRFHSAQMRLRVHHMNGRIMAALVLMLVVGMVDAGEVRSQLL
jgi:hypothetical protein